MNPASVRNCVDDGRNPVGNISEMITTRIPTLLRTVVLLLLVLALSAFDSVMTRAHAAIGLDLSYVDQHSAAYARFRDYVDGALARPGDLPYEFSATDAVYMALLTHTDTYCTFAIGLVQKQVLAANAAIAAGKAPEVASDSYLNVGPMIGDLALTYDACAAQMKDPAQREAWSAYAEQAVSNVWNHLSATWGGHFFPWTGWSTKDPGDNYYYSFVNATLFWALASGSEKWMSLLRSDKMPALQAYMATLPGGGSLEGTGYGASHMRLFALYRIWRDATKEDLANANPHLTQSISYWVNATVPTLDAFAPFGDQSRSSQPVLYDYHRRLMLEARELTANEDARQLASWWLNSISIKTMTSSFNERFDLLPAGVNRAPPSRLTYRASGVGQLFSRTSWDTDALWIAMIAGTYNQSHAHQEQGGFTLYQRGWLAVTENIWSHSGIQQGSEMNNILRFTKKGKSIPQRAPSTSSLTILKTAPGGEVHARADLGAAYGGTGSGVRAWQRDFDFAASGLSVHDRFDVAADVDTAFQINVPVLPVVSGNHVSAGDLQIDVQLPADAVIRIVDWHGVDADFLSGYRIDIQARGNEFLVRMNAAGKKAEPAK
ncbi:MAG: hypothetical protein ABIS07_17735 [Dokdonella sp.]